jgi:hypothetical protein
MSAMKTQLLSSGEFCKLRYDTIPVKSASSNVSFYTNDSKNAKFLVVTLLSQMTDIIDKNDISIHPLRSKYVEFKSFPNSQQQAGWLKDIKEYTFSNVHCY